MNSSEMNPFVHFQSRRIAFRIAVRLFYQRVFGLDIFPMNGDVCFMLKPNSIVPTFAFFLPKDGDTESKSPDMTGEVQLLPREGKMVYNTELSFHSSRAKHTLLHQIFIPTKDLPAIDLVFRRDLLKAVMQGSHDSALHHGNMESSIEMCELLERASAP